MDAGLAAIVNEYLEDKAPGEARYLRFYQTRSTATEAITKATMAELPSGKRFSHQRRIAGATLRMATAALLATDLSACRTFHELYELVHGTIGHIDGIGRLTIYDTAHRLGAYFGLSPDLVYVHAGVRDGLRALGLNHRVPRISVRDLPPAFHRLRPEQVEDCLCIYKRRFRSIATPA